MELYHLLNRGVDRRTIFLDGQDYRRFIHSMFEFNMRRPANHTKRTNLFPSARLAHEEESPNGRLRKSAIGAGITAEVEGSGQKDRLVDIHGWCLMKNHYHLLLSEREEGAITLFVRKLNIGYAKYFNERYKRSGTLFGGRTKKILINSDAHFLHILNYIHLNPLDYLEGTEEWRERKISGHSRALEYLKDYRWSSYKDYIGTPNFPSILAPELFKDVFGDYKKEIKDYLKDLDINALRPFTLE